MSLQNNEMKHEILTLEKVKELDLDHYIYDCGRYEYQTKDGFIHLIIKGVDVLAGLNAIDCYLYTGGNYEYKTKDGKWHKIK